MRSRLHFKPAAPSAAGVLFLFQALAPRFFLPYLPRAPLRPKRGKRRPPAAPCVDEPRKTL